ncbi:MAG: nitronate monooxygenase [Pseudomonadota bacterium]
MLKTRLTEAFDLRYPILSAPMAFAGGGALAAAVSHAGGLGLIGGAYGDNAWIEDQYKEAGNAPVGCGFITWSLTDHRAEGRDPLTPVLERKPKALMLSFADPMPYAEEIKSASVPLIVQTQTLAHARRAVEAGAALIIAQGSEAGGHGAKRGTLPLVAEVADYLKAESPDTLLVAAGGIVDGRGLAAALMLGADGVLMGSRFWASEEALVHPKMLEAAIAATGDDTIRSSVMDIARHLKWPEGYTARVLKNAFTERWHDDIEGLLKVADSEAARWREAWVAGDTVTANTFVGEITGMIADIPKAGEIVERVAAEAEACLKKGVQLITQ